MDILRFITAGSVDDGKSTLTGRLLYETGNISADVLRSVSDSGTGGDDEGSLNLAFIADGLRAERSGGITIDVACKYLVTPDRKYIIYDAPGHYQYTRNLVTGASGADAMIILIDARNGITSQTQRHALVAAFLRIPHVIVAVNKMDIVGYSRNVFESIAADFMNLAHRLQLPLPAFIPVSALAGDNVTTHSPKMPWYQRLPLMLLLGSLKCPVSSVNGVIFQVQYVSKQSHTLFMGKLLSGAIKKGDRLYAMPGNLQVTVATIYSGFAKVISATAGEQLGIELSEEIPVVRGWLLAGKDFSIRQVHELEVNICWLDQVAPLRARNEYLLRMGTFETACVILKVLSRADLDTLSSVSTDVIEVNEVGRILISTRDAVPCMPVRDMPVLGRGILIDYATCYTSGAFVFDGPVIGS